jgi:hypothetical protein
VTAGEITEVEVAAAVDVLGAADEVLAAAVLVVDDVVLEVVGAADEVDEVVGAADEVDDVLGAAEEVVGAAVLVVDDVVLDVDGGATYGAYWNTLRRSDPPQSSFGLPSQGITQPPSGDRTLPASNSLPQ